MQKHLSHDYASALHALAAEHRTESQICIELQSAAVAVAGNKTLEDFINCPAFPVSEKKEFVAKTFHGSHLFKNFLDLLVTRKAFNHLPAIAANYRLIDNRSKGL